MNGVISRVLDWSALSDVKLTITAELDTIRTTQRDLLTLEPGRILTLSRATGDNIDIYVGNVHFASGEVMVSEGVLGVRIAELKDTSAPVESGRVAE